MRFFGFPVFYPVMILFNNWGICPSLDQHPQPRQEILANGEIELDRAASWLISSAAEENV